MDLATAILAGVAPSLALLIEWRHPVDREMARRHADRIMTELGLVATPCQLNARRDELNRDLAAFLFAQCEYDQTRADRDAEWLIRNLGLLQEEQDRARYADGLAQVLAAIALGAASIANIVLTLAAVFTGAVAVVYELSGWLWWIAWITVAIGISAVFVLRKAWTETFLDIATEQLGAETEFTRREQLSRTVYWVNFLLLILIFLIWWGTSGQFLVVPDAHGSTIASVHAQP